MSMHKKTLRLHLYASDGTVEVVDVPTDTASRSGSVQRAGRHYTYQGAFQGNFHELRYAEVGRPVNIDQYPTVEFGI